MFLKAFQLRVEPEQPFNTFNTAAANIRFRCNFMNTDLGSHEVLGNGNEEPGSFGEWSDACPPQEGICGLSIKFENPNYIDDTAMNDVEFYCCDD